MRENTLRHCSTLQWHSCT